MDASKNLVEITEVQKGLDWVKTFSDNQYLNIFEVINPMCKHFFIGLHDWSVNLFKNFSCIAQASIMEKK